MILGSVVLFAPRPAGAETAIEGGIAVNNSASAAGALSLGLLNAPLVPISLDLTGLFPTNGGYATTLDARFHLAGTAIGAGAGFGTLGTIHSVGSVFDGLIAQTIAPHTAVEARLYFGPSRPSTFFAGLRFSL